MAQPPYAPPPQPMWTPPTPDGQVASASDTDPPGQKVSVLDAISFLFRDPNWKNNLLVGAVLMFIPIAGPIAKQGWHAVIAQRLARRDPNPIPKLDFGDLGYYISRGGIPFLITFVLVFPAVFVTYFVVGAGVFVGAAVSAQLNEPLLLVAFWAVLGLLTFVAGLLFTVVMQSAMTRAELTEDFGQSLSPGKLMPYAAAVAPITILSGMLFGFFAFLIILGGYVACIVGLYPAMVIITTAATHLRWQIYERFLAKGGEPLRVKQPEPIPSEARMMGYGYPYYPGR